MELFSWGLTFFVFFVPLVSGIVFLGAAVLLFLKIRTTAVGLFVTGVFLTLVTPFVVSATLQHRPGQNVQILLAAIGNILLVVGFLWYVLSLPKHKAN